MNYHPKLILATLALVLLLVSCNSNTIKLVNTNCKNEVPVLGNFRFSFNHSLVADSMLNNWQTSDLVKFEPKIEGNFRWEQNNELVFSPSKPLPPATSFKATISRELLKGTKYKNIEGSELSFFTPSLQLDHVNVMWIVQDETKSQASPQITLDFNFPVDPDILKEHLNIKIDGENKDYILKTASGDSKILLQILNVKNEDKDYSTLITVSKGAVPINGQNVTKEDIIENIGLPSPFILNIQNIETTHDGVNGSVKILTSQQVKQENLEKFISIKPAIKFTAEVLEDGFLITSDKFDVVQTYDLRLLKGLRGRIGGTLKDDYVNNIAFGELEPQISFVNGKGIYLNSQGLKNIEVKMVNVPTVKIIVSKIYENNILHAQQNGYYPDGDDYGYDYEYENNEIKKGDIIYSKEIETRSLPLYNNSRVLHFDISDKLQDFKGIYHIMIRSAKDYWVRDSRFISISDIGLIAKKGKDRILVFTNSIKTAQPIASTSITVYGYNNQVIGVGNTNNDGVAEIEYTQKEFSGFKPAMVIAKTADDFNYMPFSSTKVETSRFDVGGKRNNPSGLDAFIYPERDIYRPGEKVRFSVIVRDKQWKSPGEMLLKLKFLFPNGKELMQMRKTLNEQGSCEGVIDINKAAITGSYTLQVYTSNDVLLSTKNFLIEEFVPDRIKVATKVSKPISAPGDNISLSINAQNFFGPPAANRNYECQIQIRQKQFNPKGYEKFDFSLANQKTFFDDKVNQGTTDVEGNATENYVVPETYVNLGLLKASFFTTVFDETGRPVNRATYSDIYTQDIFYGISNDGYGYYPLNQAIQFSLVALTKDEKLAGNVKAEVQVIKHEYRTVLSKSGSYFRYESQKEDKVVHNSFIILNGDKNNFVFTPRTPGDYEIRIMKPGAGTYVHKSFYSYGWWGGDNNSFEVNNEGNIDIDVDKEKYNSGESAIIHFKTPFSGKMLVTFETDKVVSYQYLNVEKRDASLNFTLTDEHLPNVYITATLIKPHGISDIPLTVAHGYKSLKVDNKNRKIDVQIVAEKSVRSKTHQKITVKATPNCKVTLAAVDNGILQVSDFKPPNPYDYYYQKKALDVDGYDIYPLLLPEIKARLSSTGGDGYDLEKRVNPIRNDRIKLVSYWSGIQTTNGSGDASFEFDIPQFSGEVRLMAVAYKDENFGSMDAAMTVADPIVLSTALPRFLSPGDTVTVPVTITNTTKKATTANAELKVEGPMQVVGDNKQTVSLAANAENSVTFKVLALPSVNAGKVKVEVNGLGEKFTDETDITVRPASSLQKVTGYGSINGGSSQNINFAVNDFIPSSINYQLIISKSPVLQVAEQMSYLVQYPYGCTEQTVSAAFPQLYYSDMADLIQKFKGNKASANYHIIEAIRKIKMRQLYNGAVTLWDEGEADWWATVYAAHFLLEAKKAGFDVDNSLLSNMLNYLTSKLKNKETISYYYNRNQQKKIAPKEVAYSLYVLALAGQPQVSAMNYYKSNPDILSLDSKYLLSVAFALAGDKNKFRELLPTSFTGEESVAQTGGSFYSDVRDEAIALNCLLDVDPGNNQTGVMAKHLTDKLKQRYWLSTQERAFSFLALGKMAKAANKSDVTAVVKVNGKVVKETKGSDLAINSKELGGTNIEISTRGTGSLYYFWEAEGISSSGNYKQEDNFIKVRKLFYDRYGRLISNNTFKQNDLVIVAISLEGSYNTAVNNIVITDLLPAGFEIENPRTKELPGMEWIKDASSPTALDVRDDRINLFVDLYYKKQTYYYAVRAVSPGTYKMGPVSADAMYNGEYHSYNGGGIIKIVQ
ncbi:MAG TPA: MG2 domain-containing protein [Chitinophagaceae bacterium]|nr:MG2 domain-containing protein [Chitinophagaceae bacterium]